MVGVQGSILDKMPGNRPQASHRRLRQLIHYICWKCSNPLVLGTVRLHQVLWYADRHNYLINAKPITEAVYFKKPHGPSAADVPLLIDELEREGALAVRRPRFAGETALYFAKEEPDISGFTAQEIHLVDEAINAVCFGQAAASIGRRRHDRVWELAGLDEELPYHTVFAGTPGELTREDLEWAEAEAHRIRQGQAGRRPQE